MKKINEDEEVRVPPEYYQKQEYLEPLLHVKSEPNSGSHYYETIIKAWLFNTLGISQSAYRESLTQFTKCQCSATKQYFA